MRILVCVKRVPAPGARINVTDDGRSVNTANLGFTTSPHEECAVTEAARLADETGASVTVLTAGPAQAVEQLRYAASVGAHELVHVPTGDEAWDPQRTATALAAAIEQVEAERGRFDLALFGNESADTGGFQVGIRVARALGRPMINGIKGIDLDPVAGNDETPSVTARRAVDGGFELYRLPLPAVIGVREGINVPRYPTMKGRLASKKAEVTTIEVDPGPGGQSLVRLHRPEEVASETTVLGPGSVDEAAVEVVDLLDELGLLS